MDENYQTTVYYPTLQTEADQVLVQGLWSDDNVTTWPLDELPSDAAVTHVDSIGAVDAINAVTRRVEDELHLVAYSGLAVEGTQWHCLDIHHSAASKGVAITTLKQLLDVERVICFGNSDNDLSMFEAADESYQPANANNVIKSAATAVIGNHNVEGIAKFLRKRYSLDYAN